MRLTMLMLLVLMTSVACSRGPADCSYDREAVMALEYRAFDQDTPWGGWRGVGRDVECALVAADLIADWRLTHQEGSRPSEVRSLNWHEGQMRAKGGDYETAALLFESATYPTPEDPFEEAWNGYADASAAFARRDREAFDAAYDTMMNIEEPEDWEQFADESEEMLGRRPRWPNNIEVVESLRNCFDRSYDEAYGTDCQ